ncbi:MAG: hypothetical protein ACTSWF_00440 [Candidatus Freyarchaeota archaeon]
MESIDELATLLEETVKDDVIKGLILISKEGRSESMVILEESVDKNKLAAGSATLLSISSQVMGKLLGQTPDYILSFTQNNLVITLPINSGLVLSALLDRGKAENNGVENYVTKLQGVSRKVSEIIALSEYPKKGLFMNVKNALPEAKAIAILTSEGVPLIVHPVDDAVTVAGMISAIFTISSNMLPDEGGDFSVIASKEGMIITQQIDNDRLLAVSIPKKMRVTDVVAKIKEAVKESEL